MRTYFMTSAEFNRNPSRAKKQAGEHPLVITDHGENSYVLMRYSEFEKLLVTRSLLDVFSEGSALFDAYPEDVFEFERLPMEWRHVEF